MVIIYISLSWKRQRNSTQSKLCVLGHDNYSYRLNKGKKVSYLMSVAKQAKAAFLRGPVVWKIADCQDRTRNLSLRKRCPNHLHQMGPYTVICELFG